MIRACDVLMTASGTTTLEAALLETPMVVAYRVNALTWLTGRLLVEVDHIGLVNIVAGEEIVPELVQWNLTPDRLADCTANLLAEGPEGNTVQKLRTVREKLGPPGAARRAAQSILKSTGVNVADNESLSSRYRNHL